MATGKHTVLVNGKKVTRRSDRPYRFAIVATRDFDYDWKRAGQPDRLTRESTYNWYRDEGWKLYEGKPYAVRPEEAVKYAAQTEVARALGSYEAWIAHEIRLERAALEERRAKGAYEPQVVAWSQSDASAAKAARHHQLHGWTEIHLVPVGGEYINGEVFRGGRKLAL